MAARTKKENLTPMLAQYHAIKEKYPDAILLFRLGDFYEAFYEDAEKVSKVLNIVLTSRPAGKGRRIPMAGIPHHALNSYVHRLIHRGFKVAICEQLEDASQSKGIVRREVVRVITPGTFFEKDAAGLMAIYPKGKRWGFAYLNLSVGEFTAAVLSKEEVLDLVAKLQPVEVILPKGAEPLEEQIKPVLKEVHFTYLPKEEFFGEPAAREFFNHFKVSTLRVFNFENEEALPPLAALLLYAKRTQKEFMPFVRRPKPYTGELYAKVDLKAQRALELLESADGKGEFSLFAVLDRTLTGMGRRRLRFKIVHPYKKVSLIRETQEAVEELYENGELRETLRSLLEKVYDAERLVSKISSSIANAKDLVMLKQSLKVAAEIKELLEERAKSSLLRSIAERIGDPTEVINDIERTLVDDPPYQVKEGGLIRDGVDPYLDELRAIRNDAEGWLKRYQEKLRRELGISSLKIGFNKVMGFFVEITKPNLRYAKAWIEKGLLRRRQTLTNAERFITDELQRFEEKFLSAEEKIKSLEYKLFRELRDRVLRKVDQIGELAAALGELDYLQSLATTAAENFWVKPQVVEGGIETFIKDGRHPVIEAHKKVFVPNDTTFSDDERLLIITGPNAAGKSSYIRQVALIFLLAQMGSFVPAAEARISVADAFYTRVGSGDMLALGVSTFMNEMHEVANVLSNATERSLIILDEVGRGTATYDGIAVATAVAEYLAERIGARTLFATHYHELTRLEGRVRGVVNYHMEVKETAEGGIEFLYTLKRGPSSKSFGVAVAKMAGLPDEVVRRAEEILKTLEGKREEELKAVGEPRRTARVDRKRKPYEKPSVEVKASEVKGGKLSEGFERIKGILEEVDIARTTPLEALLKLAELKRLI